MKKVLMCPPTAYDIEYVINPWMDMENQPNRRLAHEQWRSIYETYLKLGVEVETIEQVKGLPDMVFTANAGIVKGNTFVSGNYRYKERKGEEMYFQKWFTDHGFTVKKLNYFQGGEGDALFYKGTLYLGYGFRSDIKAHEELKEALGVSVVSFLLTDPYFYDFDTTFCPMGDRGLLYYRDGYDEKSKEIAASIDGAIPITKEQAANFVCNSVYVDGKLLIGYLDEDLKKKLFTLDIEPILFNMSEYKKSGGGIKCLTLYLDQ